MTPARTTGGTFDPNARFMYFIAGSPDRVAGETKYDRNGQPDNEAIPLPQHPHVLVAVNELRSPKDIDILRRLCETRKVMLDSGIFNLAMTHATIHGVSHDVALGLAPEEIDGFDELWDRYAAVVAEFSDSLWGIVELDQGGVAHKPRTRARIETELGIVPMPVYHPLLDGWDYYDQLARGYDRICFGNLVKASPPARLRLIHTASQRARQYPYLWTHLLGCYPNENILGMPLRGSCDSSSWVTSERWAPSWKGWAMTKMVTHYPPPMWGNATVNAGADHHYRLRALNAVTANSLVTTLDMMAEDTHTWLTPPRRAAL